MREIDMTWTVATIAKHCGVSAPTVKKVIREANIPLYQKVGTYRLYDHRLLAAVRAYKIKMDSPEWKAHCKEQRMKNLHAGRDAYFNNLREGKLSKKAQAANQQARVPDFDLDTLVRIERKLDTILKELNVKFEG